MTRRVRSPALAAATLLMAAAAPAFAQTTYSGTGAGASAAAASFAAAISASTLETFDARPDGEAVSNWSYAGGGTASLSNGFGVTSTYPFGGVAVSPTRGYQAYPEGGVGGDPVFSFSAPLRAFGAYFVDVELPDTLIFSLLGGGTISYAAPVAGDGGVSFFGVDFGVNKIIGLTLDLDFTDAVLIDDVRVAIMGGVPEPGTWALMIGGFAASGAVLRRKRAVARA